MTKLFLIAGTLVFSTFAFAAKWERTELTETDEMVKALSKLNAHSATQLSSPEGDKSCNTDSNEIKTLKDLGFYISEMVMNERWEERSTADKIATRIGTLGFSSGSTHIIYTDVVLTLTNHNKETQTVKFSCKGILPSTIAPWAFK